MKKIATKTSYNLDEIFKISLFNYSTLSEWHIEENRDSKLIYNLDADNLLWLNGIRGNSTSDLMELLGDDYIYDKIDMEFRLKPHIVIEYKNGKKDDIIICDNYMDASFKFDILNNALSNMSFRFQVL